ncbi:hypothetical protein [Terricaulis sp.]|uniref:hypothetical protein n=1 Tax=Terricaulis sp. TaxID=2768686 RepID=UPI00378400EA
MLRTLILVCALAAPGWAAAEQFPQSAEGALVVADDGTPLGRATRIERNAEGRIVAAEIEGLEPADARPEPQLVAEVSGRTLTRIEQEQRQRRGQGGTVRLQRAR